MDEKNAEVFFIKKDEKDSEELKNNVHATVMQIAFLNKLLQSGYRFEQLDLYNKIEGQLNKKGKKHGV